MIQVSSLHATPAPSIEWNEWTWFFHVVWRIASINVCNIYFKWPELSFPTFVLNKFGTYGNVKTFLIYVEQQLNICGLRAQENDAYINRFPWQFTRKSSIAEVRHLKCFRYLINCELNKALRTVIPFVL